MPLARIITRTPQDAIAASEYLLAQGYTVETVSPREFHITPAEIELNLEGCRPEEAVVRAKALVESQAMARQEKTEEAAAPEPARPQQEKIPVAYDITGRPVEFSEQEETAHRTGGALASLRAALAEAWQSVKSPVRGLQREEEELAEQQQERARVAALHEAMIVAERDGAHEQQLRQIDPTAPVPEVAAEVPQPPPQPSPVHTQPLLKQHKRAPGMMVHRALATAAGAGLLLLLAFIAYANRRPASPLSPAALMRDGQVKQDLPFGPATIVPTPLAVVPRPSASVPAKASPAVRPVTRKPSAGRRSAQPLRRPSRQDSAAEDEVVVRRFTPPRARPQPSTAKLERDSDTD